MKSGSFDKLSKEMNETEIIIKPVEILKIILPKIDFAKTRHKGKNIFKIFKFSILFHKIQKVFILILLIYFILIYVVVKFDFNKNKEIISYAPHEANISFINIYVIAHKDFLNKINNVYYKILCDNKTQLKKNYPLQIIETYKDNELFKKKMVIVRGLKFIIFGKNI